MTTQKLLKQVLITAKKVKTLSCALSDHDEKKSRN